MKPETKYPKKSKWNRVCDNYYKFVKSIINKHINLEWNECLKIIKKHVPEKYMYIVKDWFPDRVNRYGDLDKGYGGLISKDKLTRPFMYPIIYIDKDGVIRETSKAIINKGPKKPSIKVERIDYWDPKYKIDFEINTNSEYSLSLLKYWQSPLLRDKVGVDFDAQMNPVAIKLDYMYYINNVPIEKFIKFCEKNKYTYRIIQGTSDKYFGWRSIKYYYKPFYEE